MCATKAWMVACATCQTPAFHSDEMFMLSTETLDFKIRKSVQSGAWQCALPVQYTLPHCSYCNGLAHNPATVCLMLILCVSV